MNDGEIVLGVDTHKDLHVGVVTDLLGKAIGHCEIEVSSQGFSELVAWAKTLGAPKRAGVEGTGSYGKSLAAYLLAEGIEVLEINRPNRQHRRRHGKSDVADALGAAKAVLSGEALAMPKNNHGSVESMRVLMVARDSAIDGKTRAANRLESLLITAPIEFEEQFAGLTRGQQAKKAVEFRITENVSDPVSALKMAMGSLAKQYLESQSEAKMLEQQIAALVSHQAPTLLAEKGVGVLSVATLLIACGQNPTRITSESKFAALCGVSPVDASSGKVSNRHRLNRGGNRQANRALYIIALVRLRHDEETKEYVARKIEEGKTIREAIRCLKRFIARRIHKQISALELT